MGASGPECDLSSTLAEWSDPNGLSVQVRPEYAPYGIHVVADDADVWEVLSGQPATWGRANPSASAVHAKWSTSREWLNATDLGKLLSPAISAVKVNKALEALGFQTKIDGVWTPSEKASGLHKMRQGASAYGTQGKEIPVWHRSTADLIEEYVSRSTRA